MLGLARFPQAVRPAAASSPEGLSCKAALEITRFVWNNVPNNIPLDDEAYIGRVLDRYLDRLDPYRVLILRSEAEAFRKQARGYWNAFLSEQNCQGFENWLAAYFPALQKRFAQSLRSLPLEGLFPQPLPRSYKVPFDLPEYEDYAVSPSELSQRLAAMVKNLAAGTTPDILRAYKHDKLALVDAGLRKFLFHEEEPHAVHLLTRAAVNGIDVFSEYFSREEYRDYHAELVVGDGGVGVEIREVPEGLLVLEVAEDSAADRSGTIHAGDTIVAVDGRRLRGEKTRMLRNVLRGPEQTTVVLRVRSPGQAERSVRIVRQPYVERETRVSWKIVDANAQRVAVIAIPSFYGQTDFGTGYSVADDVEKAVRGAMKKSVDSIVLDMRGNPGGYLHEAVKMASVFLGSRPIVRVVGKHEDKLWSEVGHLKPVYEGPLVALLDSESASAAEILAGALKDHGRALIVGDKTTYCKGSVQRMVEIQNAALPLDQKDASGVVKLTTSYFYSPLGQSPADGGIRSDIVLPERIAAAKYKRPKREQSVPRLGSTSSLSHAVEVRRVEVQEHLSALRQSPVVQDSEIRRVFDQAVSRAFRGEELEQDKRENLAQSLAIAAEWAKLEQTHTR